MKKLVAGLMLLSSVAQAACFGPYCYNGEGAQVPTSVYPLGLQSYTLAQMNLLTPAAAGVLIFVSDGLQAKVCVSSGTGTGAFVVLAATSTIVVGGLTGHCN
jgi:hypothetical protein